MGEDAPPPLPGRLAICRTSCPGSLLVCFCQRGSRGNNVGGYRGRRRRGGVYATRGGRDGGWEVQVVRGLPRKM